ncbi:ovochymase-like [Euwallacea similis]|uniref:ovochymase-like n=1 Tax=Euwallacea similis TaxID=1736056 RepID=UPI00344E7BF2
MDLNFCLLIISICLKSTRGQQIDVKEFSSSLNTNEVLTNSAPLQLKFMKDRTELNTRIIGGDVATPHEYPFQVALYIYVYSAIYFCGGSLITPEWVLTAAHCTESATNITVVLGSHNISAETETSRVVYHTATYIVHENWNLTTLQNDISLIKLPQNVTLNDYIDIVPIAGGTNLYTGSTSTILGWGLTIAGSLSSVLRYVNTPVISNDECTSYDAYSRYIVDHHLCTSGNGTVGSCNGDSGGPILINGTQVGLVSFGVTNCSAGYPSVNTRLTEFYTWINETISNTGASHKIKCGIYPLFIIVGYFMRKFGGRGEIAIKMASKWHIKPQTASNFLLFLNTHTWCYRSSDQNFINREKIRETHNNFSYLEEEVLLAYIFHWLLWNDFVLLIKCICPKLPADDSDLRYYKGKLGKIYEKTKIPKRGRFLACCYDGKVIVPGRSSFSLIKPARIVRYSATMPNIRLRIYSYTIGCSPIDVQNLYIIAIYKSYNMRIIQQPNKFSYSVNQSFNELSATKAFVIDMDFKVILLMASVCLNAIHGQRIDIDEFSNSLGTTEIPIREPPSEFKFMKDRTQSVKRIIGGDVATQHEYPFQAALYIYVYITQYFCGGSLVAPNWVLTAAHCTQWATNITVVLGAHDLSKEEDSRIVYATTKYVIHENWNSMTFQNDVSLVRLPEKVTLSNYIDIVPVAAGTNLYTGQTSVTLGWGLTIAGYYSTELRYVDAPVISNNECKSYEDYANYIVDHHLCTSGEGTVGSCNGDSGGPILVNGTQIGLVSFGVTNCSAGYPSVNTRLTEFYTWINETISNTGVSYKIECGIYPLFVIFSIINVILV